MLNFAIGPVLCSENILEAGRRQLPYFRTTEFSNMMKENESLIKMLMKAEKRARVIFMTGSGTASMEAVVMNMFTPGDRVIVVNGGSFGQRFVDLCEVFDIEYVQIPVKAGKKLTQEMLNQIDLSQSYDGFLINMHETSTGVLYDMEMVGQFCKKNNIMLVVDAISSFLADELFMEKWGIDVVITGSQKALALPPGVSVIVLNNKAMIHMNGKKIKSLYFNLPDYLKNGERGQTPFTPAVGILLQLNLRLREICDIGIEQVQETIAVLAQDFRSKIKDFPFEIFSESLSNAVTPLRVTSSISAHKVFEILKDEYDIFVCPNGGELADTVLRIGHIGELSLKDNEILIQALKDMQKRVLL